MLEDGEIGGAFPVHMHDVVLNGIGILHRPHIAQQHGDAVHHPDGDILELIHRIGAGV